MPSAWRTCYQLRPAICQSHSAISLVTHAPRQRHARHAWPHVLPCDAPPPLPSLCSPAMQPKRRARTGNRFAWPKTEPATAGPSTRLCWSPGSAQRRPGRRPADRHRASFGSWCHPRSRRIAHCARCWRSRYAALRYVLSHSSSPITIPGAKSPEQAAMNAAAGHRLLTAAEIDVSIAARL